ncbi:hypothetical protein ACPF8X_34955 [Streptomyces sp. G35A]
MDAGRLYCIQSWNDASRQSGEQIGNRLAQSQALHMTRDGKANVALYADEAPKPKAKKKRSIVERVSLADSHYNRLEALSLELDKELENGNVSFEDYAYLRQVMDSRLEKAWNRLAKARGFVKDELADENHNGFRQNVDFDSKNYGKQSDSKGTLRGVSIDYSSVDMPAVFDSLKNDNVFKKIAFWVLTARKAIAKILPTATISEQNEMKTLGNLSNSKHSYELGTDKGRVTVYANTRAQARKIAEREGYEVRDVNMVG